MSLSSAQSHYDSQLPPDNDPTPLQLVAEEIKDSNHLEVLLGKFADVEVRVNEPYADQWMATASVSLEFGIAFDSVDEFYKHLTLALRVAERAVNQRTTREVGQDDH